MEKSKKFVSIFIPSQILTFQVSAFVECREVKYCGVQNNKRERQEKKDNNLFSFTALRLRAPNNQHNCEVFFSVETETEEETKWICTFLFCSSGIRINSIWLRRLH